MRARILNVLKVVGVAVVLVAGISYASPYPSCVPPGCNAAAPINVSSTAQEKAGAFSARSNAGPGIIGQSTSAFDFGLYGLGDPATGYGVYGSGLTGVLGTGVYGVLGRGTAVDFLAAQSGYGFSDGSKQKTAVTWKMCEGSNSTTFNQAFMVPPSWTVQDCFNELYTYHFGGGLSWWRVGCFSTGSPGGSSWGSNGGVVLPANNSCGWGAPPPPPPPPPRPTLLCIKFPDLPDCL